MLIGDTHKRATFDKIDVRSDVNPTDRDIRWFKHIERHGALTSTQLIAWTADTHRCRDTALRRLQALRAVGFLYLPKQQRACERAEFRPYVYDLAFKGFQYLANCGLREETARPTGHWWHLHETAMFTAQIDLEARGRGFRYIPAHEILERAGSTLAISIGRRNLIPDQIFAIDYGGLFRAFMVEVDRGTEPIASKSTRKSWKSSLALYDEAFRLGLLNHHYGLKAPVQVLWAHRTGARRGAFEKLLGALSASTRQRHICSRIDSVGAVTAPWTA
ncbi:replication-relaxation family protein [Gymnodinialimonas sp.]